MNVEVKLLSGALGAEIKGIDLTDVSDENFNKINNLLLEHKVIFFRDQPLTSKQHIALAEKFGHQVIDLKRTAIEELELKDLQEGQWRELNKDEIKYNLHFRTDFS